MEMNEFSMSGGRSDIGAIEKIMLTRKLSLSKVLLYIFTYMCRIQIDILLI